MPGHPLALLGPLSTNHLLTSLGVAAVLIVLFAETGLLIGFFLPGDTLLFAAGAATIAHNSITGASPLPLGWLIVAGIAGAVIGAQTGFELGRRAGPPLLRRETRALTEENVAKVRRVLDRFGPRKAVFFARFLPLVRTVMNPLVGVLGMPVRDFTIANAVGGVVWPTLLIVIGHFLGHITVVRTHLEWFVIAGFLCAVIPVAYESVRRGRSAVANRS